MRAPQTEGMTDQQLEKIWERRGESHVLEDFDALFSEIRRLRADGATLRERVETALTADVLAELVRRMDAYFRKRTQPTERDRSVEESRSYLMAVLFPASAPKEGITPDTLLYDDYNDYGEF